MSTLYARVLHVDEVLPHGNADALEVARVGGWQVVVGKGTVTPGEAVVHVPPDAMVPRYVAEKWGVAQHLSWGNGRDAGRVRAVRLRGETSHGFIVAAPDGLDEGYNAAEFYGLTKYEHQDHSGGDGMQERDHPLFPRYTEIENARHFPKVLADWEASGEPVTVTEKIHGMNGRWGLVRDGGKRTFMVGSHGIRRRLGAGSVWEEVATANQCIRALLDCVLDNNPDGQAAVLYGEVFGHKVQDLQYGRNDKTFAAFDLMVNGEYQPHMEFEELCHDFGVPMVPLIADGPFDAGMVGLAKGNSLVQRADHIREGCVITAQRNTTHTEIGRAILKVVSDDYLTRKGGTERH